MRRVHLAARIARYVWAAPCTAVGLCLVAPAFLFGATARVVDGAIEVALSAFKSSNILLGALPFNAITFVFRLLAIFFDWRTKSVRRLPINGRGTSRCIEAFRW